MTKQPKDKQLGSGAIRRLFRRFGPYLRPYRFGLGMAGLCLLGVTAMQLLRPWPLKFVFDAILIPQEKSPALLEQFPAVAGNPDLLLGLIALSILAIAVFTGLFGYGQTYLSASIGQKVVASVRRDLYRHIQRLSHSFHDESRTGDLLARLTGDVRLIRELLVSSLMLLADKLLIVAAMLAIMLWMDWQLTLVALAVLPLLSVTVARFGREIKGATKRQRRKESEIANVLTEKLSAITVVQSFARGAHEDERFSRENDGSLQAGLVSTRLEAHLSRLVQVLVAVGVAAVVWLGVKRVQTGVLSPGDLLVFIAYLKGLYKPLNKLSGLTKRIAKATVCGERVLTILDTEPDIKDAPDAIEAPAFGGEIIFADVDFAYRPDTLVLREADFRIAPGERVALVGGSGSGKSTIASLILRLYDPTRGRVLVDGIDIRQYALTSLRDQIAVVLQDSVLFSTTIAENIAYGKLEASRDEIVAAAKAANAHEFIEQLPEGYDTVVGERGDTLSGGQRQRIAIARAIIREASIVILDEPTTGLDDDNKTIVEEALTRLSRNRTCLMISHDRAAAGEADRILMVRDGRVLEVSREDFAKRMRRAASPVDAARARQTRDRGARW